MCINCMAHRDKLINIMQEQERSHSVAVFWLLHVAKAKQSTLGNILQRGGKQEDYDKTAVFPHPGCSHLVLIA